MFELRMVDAAYQIEHYALERGHLRTCVAHSRDTHIAILHLHRCAGIDDHEDVDVALKQVEGCLLHANVRLAAV